MYNYQDIKSLRSHDFTPIFYAISRLSPHVGAATSFLNALHDMYDFVAHVFKNNVRERPVILKASFGKFCSNSIIGLANMTPIICVAAFLLTNPLFLPILALHPISMDFIKYSKLVKSGIQEVNEKKMRYLTQPTEAHREDLKDATNHLYLMKQELAISTGLIIGAAISIAGIFFPPLLMTTLIFSISIAAVGFIDKRYQYSRKIYQFFCGKEEYIPYAPSIVPITSPAVLRTSTSPTS
jgi:hypothetical protein